MPILKAIMIEAGFLAFVPAITAVITVLIIRDVIASLFIGVITGAIIAISISGGGLFDFLSLVFETIFSSTEKNVPLITYMLLMGAIVNVITISGGHIAYGRWVSKKIKSMSGVSLAAIALGILIFIDDYFSCLLTGAIMGPSFDRCKMPRAKLAYFIDSTAAPICILAPISSWTITIADTCEKSGMAGGFLTFVKSIPYNFYAIFTLLFVIYIAITKKDFGYMKKCKPDKITEDAPAAPNGILENNVSKNAKIIDLILPNAALILLTLFSMLYLGDYFGAEKKSIVEAIGDTQMELAITYGCFAALLLCFLLYIPRRLVSVRHFFDGALEGMKSMFTAIVILVMAWTLSSITTTNLGAGAFIEDVMSNVQGTVEFTFLPFVIFIISAIISFGLGSWGTFLVTIPLIAVIARAAAPDMFYLYLGSTLAGSVFGDHASPITDTTILSSLGAKCDHITHVKSQLPYALLTCAAAAVAYCFIGKTGSMFFSYAAGFLSIIAALFFIYKIAPKTQRRIL